MPDQAVTIVIPEQYVSEVRVAFQAELNLSGPATQSDFIQWVRDRVKEVVIRQRENSARTTALQGIDRSDPTAAPGE